MLTDFPFVNLPNDLLELLKGEYHNSKESLTKLSIAVEQNPGLKQIVKKTMGEYDPEGRIEAIVKNLGFEAFRSRLSSIYIQKLDIHKFPEKSSLDRVQKITDLANSLQELSVMNSSRIFLLGVYLEFSSIYLTQSGQISHLEIPKEIIAFLLKRKSKNTKLDWLVLLTWHFIEYFGRDPFLALLKKYNNDYQNVYLSMNEDSRFKMMANLLSYGSSIQDYDTFIYERV